MLLRQENDFSCFQRVLPFYLAKFDLLTGEISANYKQSSPWIQVRQFAAAIRYYANSDSFFQLTRPLVSVDVSPNPVPVTNTSKCFVCFKTVAWNHRAINCDQCHKWCHTNVVKSSRRILKFIKIWFPLIVFRQRKFSLILAPVFPLPTELLAYLSYNLDFLLTLIICTLVLIRVLPTMTAVMEWKFLVIYFRNIQRTLRLHTLILIALLVSNYMKSNLGCHEVFLLFLKIPSFHCPWQKPWDNIAIRIIKVVLIL